MRVRTIEIRWHDNKPINSCDFQPVSLKRARPASGNERDFAGQSYRLATAGDDGNIRVCVPSPSMRTALLNERCLTDANRIVGMDGVPEHPAPQRS